MKIKLFYQSLLSDWNNNHAHFLRGIVKALLKLGHTAEVYESEDGWSLTELIKNKREVSLIGFHKHYPELMSNLYTLERFEADKILNDADLVIVHECNDPALIKLIGNYHRTHDHFKLLFHDTHPRCKLRPREMFNYDLQFYDGVLTSGNVIRDWHLEKSNLPHAWTWHEAADTELFKPLERPVQGDVVLISNWENNEHFEEVMAFFVEPVQELALRVTVYGVDYSRSARNALSKAGIHYGDYLPNYNIPTIYARHKIAIHIPGKERHVHLPGLPSAELFEAMACGIPLISTWADTEQLFSAGQDFITVCSPVEMKEQLHRLLHDEAYAAQMASRAHNTIINKHTCYHRTQELMTICQALGIPTGREVLIKS